MKSEELESLVEKIHSLDRAVVIFICGMQGTRKSSTAVQLASVLGIKVVQGTDQLRDVARWFYPDNPYLQRSTHQCWELVGEQNHENIVTGYMTQSALVVPVVEAVLKLARERRENMIFEGVHLAPALYRHLADEPKINFHHFLLAVEDEELHRANISLKIRLRHNLKEEWQKYKIDAIVEIQKHLLASRPDNVCLVNSTTPEKNADKIMEVMRCRLS